MTGGVISGYENDGSLQSSFPQAAEAIVEEQLAHVPAPIFSRHRQVIDPAPPPIMSAKRGSDDGAIRFRDTT